MNNPNPLIPQGSLLEQQAKGKPHLRIALCIAAAHVVFLGLLLMQGCKREEDPLPTTELAPEELPFGRLDVTSLYPTNRIEPEPVLEEPIEPGITGTVERLMPTLPTPPPSLPDPPPTVPRVREHKVEQGDTYTSLAREYETTISAIARANPNVDPARLRIGQNLLIPPPEPGTATAVQPDPLPAGVEVYTVKAGDTLTSIAKAHRTTVSAIRELNRLTTDRILVNQKLQVPVTNATPGTARP
jgi:LysM repeat protein